MTTRLVRTAIYSVFLTVLIALIHANTAQGQQLVREGEASAGAVSKVAIASVDSTVELGLVVTAVRDGGGKLKLIAWQASGSAQAKVAGTQFIVRKGDASAGAISKLAIVGVGDHKVITAVRDGVGNLKLIAWHVSADGVIERRGEASAGAISEIAIDQLSSGRFVTAVRDGSGKLKLIVWDISADGKSIVRKGDASGDAVSKVAVVSTGGLGNGHSVVTAVSDGGGKLKLIAWRVSQDGQQVVPKGQASAGAVSAVEAAWLTELSDPGAVNVRDVVLTAVRDGGGNLKLIAWHIGADTTQQIVRKGDASGGAISNLAVARVATPFKTDRLITAVRTGGGILKLIAWDSPSSAGQIVGEGEAAAGAISDVAIARTYLRYLVTAVRDDSGNLKLIGWKHSGP